MSKSQQNLQQRWLSPQEKTICTHETTKYMHICIFHGGISILIRVSEQYRERYQNHTCLWHFWVLKNCCPHLGLQERFASDKTGAAADPKTQQGKACSASTKTNADPLFRHANPAEFENEWSRKPFWQNSLLESSSNDTGKRSKTLREEHCNLHD